MRDFYRIGVFGVVALVALRVGIGWHFFQEGVDKVRSGTFSSEAFLKSSEGRLSSFFHGLVWDADGSLRLDEDQMVAHIENSTSKVKQRYTLSQEQEKEIDRYKERVVKNLTELYKENMEDIDKYRKGDHRAQRMQDSAQWSEVKGLRDQKNQINRQRLAEVWPVVESVDALIKQYERDLNSVISNRQSTGQRTERAYYIGRPGEGVFSSTTIDRIVPIFDLTVGILLMIGLLVRLAGCLGALFLLGVILSQFPGDAGTQPTYFQAVEALALVVLASIGAGRFAGLDFFTWSYLQNRKAGT